MRVDVDTRGAVPCARITCALFLALLLLAALCVTTTARAQAPQTIVSLTFDDGAATQFQADQALVDHGMRGTFYINSSRLDTNDYYMTLAQVRQLASHGHEIGGHTAHHVNLLQTDQTEAQREICLDRVNLLNEGFDVKNFAYPYGAFDASVKQMVEACGYNSARTSSPRTAETIPPTDPYAVHEATGSGDLATLKTQSSRPSRAAAGGSPSSSIRSATPATAAGSFPPISWRFSIGSKHARRMGPW